MVENPDGTLWIDIHDMSEVDPIRRRLSELGVSVTALVADPTCGVTVEEVRWGDLYPKIVPRNGPEPGIIVAPGEIPPGHTLLLGAHTVAGAPHQPKLVIVLSLAVYGTVALAIDQPGAGISTDSAALPQPTSTDQPLEVQVIAQQWWFTYRYPTYGGVETSQLVLPVNQKIQFHITSLDVIHSFWFFALGVKADAVPLNDNVVTATPDATGTYRVQCSELCGLWHGNMSDDTAMVVSPSDFATWIHQQQALDAPIANYLPPYSHTYVPSPTVYGS